MYHMTVACGGGLGKVGTDYEQLIAKLMAVEGEVGSSFWKDPVLLYTKELLVRSLTTLPSEDLQKKALELFKVSSSVRCCIERIVVLCFRYDMVDYMEKKVLELFKVSTF